MAPHFPQVPSVTKKSNTILKAKKRVVTLDGRSECTDVRPDQQPEAHEVDAKARGPPTIVDPLLTVEEVAKLLRVSVSCLNKWRIIGVGPHFVRIGKRVRYHRAAVAAYIAQQTRVSTSAEIAPAA
jgi:excisionase family DNA binding protein